LGVCTRWKGDETPDNYFTTTHVSCEALTSGPIQSVWSEDGMLIKEPGTSFELEFLIQTEAADIAVARLNIWEIRNAMKKLTPQCKDSLCDFILPLQGGPGIKRKAKGKLHVRARLMGTDMFDCLTYQPLKDHYYANPALVMNLKDRKQVCHYLNMAKLYPIMHNLMNLGLYFNGCILKPLIETRDCSLYLETMENLPSKDLHAAQQVYAYVTANLFHGYYRSFKSKSLVPLKAFVTALDRVTAVSTRQEMCDISYMMMDKNQNNKLSFKEFRMMNKQCSILHRIFFQSQLPFLVDKIMKDINVREDKRVKIRAKVKLEKYMKKYQLKKMTKEITNFGYKMANSDGDAKITLFEYTEWFLNPIDQQTMAGFAEKEVLETLETFQRYVIAHESRLRNL